MIACDPVVTSIHFPSTIFQNVYLLIIFFSVHILRCLRERKFPASLRIIASSYSCTICYYILIYRQRSYRTTKRNTGKQAYESQTINQKTVNGTNLCTTSTYNNNTTIGRYTWDNNICVYRLCA